MSTYKTNRQTLDILSKCLRITLEKTNLLEALDLDNDGLKSIDDVFRMLDKSKPGDTIIIAEGGDDE